MSSATDRLRELLDERGAEWDYGITGATTTRFNVNGVNLTFTPMRDGLVCSTIFTPEQAIAATLGSVITGDTSDGYHTFNELYHHRAVLFSVIVRDHSELAWKSKLHSDSTMYNGMFIVGIETPQGQATYHYDIDPYWDMFECKELNRAPEWDGHTPDESIARIATLGSSNCTNGERTNGTCHRLPADNFVPTCIVRGRGYEMEVGYWKCSECGTNCFEGARYCMNCGREVVDE